MTYSSTPPISSPNYQQSEHQADSPRLLKKAECRLIDTGAAISLDAPVGDDLMFSHSIFCNIGLPRKRVNGQEFRREFGAAWLNVQAGVLDLGDGPVPQAVPYGAMPRVVLAWIATSAIRHQSKVIDIGRSAAEFLRMLGMDSQGNRYRTLRLQLNALFACRLQFGFQSQTFDSTMIQPAGERPQRDSSVTTSWPGVLVLTDELYQELIMHCVPLDRRAFRQLKGSALGIDIYTWLAYRLHQIAGRPISVSWRSLQKQFGHEYRGIAARGDFRKSFLRALVKVQIVYPRAKVEPSTSGLTLHWSPPPVAKNIANTSSTPRHAQRNRHSQTGGHQ